MDQVYEKRVRKCDDNTEDMDKSDVKVRKLTEDAHVDSLVNEKSNSSNESDNAFQENENPAFVAVYTDQESSDDPLQFYSDPHEDLQGGIDNARSIVEVNINEGHCNEQNSVDPDESETIEQIKQWVISCKVPHKHVNKLLKILKRKLLPAIPLRAEDLLQFESGNRNAKNNLNNNKLDVSLPVINASNVKCKSDFESFVLTQLVMQHSNMQRIENKLGNLTDILLDKKVGPSKIEFTCNNDIDFKTKYNLSLPISEKHLFMIFDELLKTDESLENDVCIELNKHVDKINYSISKSYLAMIRAFMTKNVAMQYTASRHARQTTDIPKDIFKYTKFYDCIEKVFLSARNKTSLTTTNSELMSNLSDVLSNCKKWNEKTK